MPTLWCVSCGAQTTTPRARFCTACGVALERRPVSQPALPAHHPTPPVPSLWGGFAIVLGVSGWILPYFAAVFLVPTAALCTLVAFTKGQKLTGLVAALFLLAGVVRLAETSTQIQTLLTAPFVSHTTAPEGSSLTLADYHQLRQGMDYATVRRLLGRDGVEMSRTTYPGGHAVSRVWQNSDGSNIVIIFQQGRVEVLAQYGLQ